LNVDDRIQLQFTSSIRLKEAIETYRDYLKAETLAIQFEQVKEPKGEAIAKHEFDGEKITLALSSLPE
jgi:hypothetical protein